MDPYNKLTVGEKYLQAKLFRDCGVEVQVSFSTL